MSDMIIARFVDMNACKSIFSDNSTFVLRSAEHYRSLEEKDGGDPYEGRPNIPGSGTAESDHWLISCWTKLKDDVPTQAEWKIFNKWCKEKPPVVAIISTPSKVCGFLEREFKSRPSKVCKFSNVFKFFENAIKNKDGKLDRYLREPFLGIQHKGVTYYPPPEKVTPPNVDNKITPENIMEKSVFTKRCKFHKEKEHRFALYYGYATHLINSYIFSVKNTDYMDICFANPEMCEEDKGKLLDIIRKAQNDYTDFENKPLDKIFKNAAIVWPGLIGTSPPG